MLLHNQFCLQCASSRHFIGNWTKSMNYSIYLPQNFSLMQGKSKKSFIPPMLAGQIVVMVTHNLGSKHFVQQSN